MKLIRFFVYLVMPFCYAQPGTLDTTFDPYGVYNSSDPNNYETITDVALQQDGKIIIVGSFNYCNGYLVNRIARLNSDGSIDLTFNAGGSGVASSESINTVAIQSDGKILIGGNFTSYNGMSKRNIARLNPDGSLEPSFVNLGPTQSDYGGTGIYDIVYQPENGKITLAGYFTKFDTTTIRDVIRLNSDGTIDSTFQQLFATNGSVSTLAYQSDGKVIVGGNFGQVNSINSRSLARINANRSYDPSFAIEYINQTIFDVIVQPDQKILVSGNFTAYGSTPVHGLIRLNSNGSLDTSFSTSINRLYAYAMFLQNDGKILVSEDSLLNRYNSDGTLDSSFATGTTTALVRSFAIQPNERIIVVGAFSNYNGVIRRSIARINGDLLAVNQYDKNQLTIYPNPTNSVLNLQLPNILTIDKVNIIDVSGKTLLEETQNTNQLNVENLATGIYIIKAFSENQVFQTKFVKQ